MTEEVFAYFIIGGALCYLVLAIMLLACIRRLEKLERNCKAYLDLVAKHREEEDASCIESGMRKHN